MTENKIHSALWPPVEIAFTADGGAPGTGQTAVANLIENHSPAVDLLVLGGDNVYSPATPEAALAAYADWIAAGKVIGSLGNHDLDLGLTAVLDLFPSPFNRRYFSHRIGPLEIFNMDSGYNSAHVLVEPDGNNAISKQADQIREWIGNSTAQWKGLVLHHAPYSSGSNHGSETAMRWVDDLDVDFVLSGHEHNYERHSVNGRPYFVVGVGGKDTYPFGPLLPSSQAAITGHFGALFFRVEPTVISFRFENVSGVQLDAYSLTKSQYEGRHF
jgi:hypothetical protein